jgi:hypothetical protein
MSDGAGNAAQTRIIAEQLFEVWKAEQAREAKDNRRFLGSSIPGWVATLVVIGTAIGTAFSTYDLAADANERSIKNENAIVQMRVSNSDRLARIETKLDRILEEGSK